MREKQLTNDELEQRLVSFGGDDVNTVSTVRLKHLGQMMDKYHEWYLNLGKYPKRLREQRVEEIVGIYIPNVVRDFPGLYKLVEVLKNYVKHLEREVITLRGQRDKAYSWLEWTVNDYVDTAEHLPMHPSALTDEEQVLYKPKRLPKQGK